MPHKKKSNPKKRTCSTLSPDLKGYQPTAKRPYNVYGRADTSQYITDPIDTTIKAPKPIRPLKTTCLLNYRLFRTSDESDKANIAHQLDERFAENVESYRKIHRVISHTPGGTPSSVTVEGDEPGQEETLMLSCHLGTAAIFSNNPALLPINRKPNTTICSGNPILDTPALAKVIPAEGKSKTQNTTITRTSLQKTKKENKARSGQRAMSQNKAVAAPNVTEKEASASRYAAIFQEYIDLIICEWLHLIGHQFEGSKSQTVENLVAGTDKANTEMLLIIEQHIKLLSDAYPDGFKLSVEAQLIAKHVQIANMIKYNISTPDFELPLSFNAQTKNKPHTDYGKYFGIVIETLIEHANAKKAASSSEHADANKAPSSSELTTPPRSITPTIIQPFFEPKPIPKRPEKVDTKSIRTPTKESGIDQLREQAPEKNLQIKDPAYDSKMPLPSRPSTPPPEQGDDSSSILMSPSHRFLRGRNN